MRNLTGWVVAFPFAVVVAGIVPVNAAPVTSAEMLKPATPGQGGVPAPRGRLKFKSSGPVCMCAEGLGERDIEQALAKSQSDKVADGNADASPGNSQKKTFNSGVAK